MKRPASNRESVFAGLARKLGEMARENDRCDRECIALAKSTPESVHVGHLHRRQNELVSAIGCLCRTGMTIEPRSSEDVALLLMMAMWHANAAAELDFDPEERTRQARELQAAIRAAAVCACALAGIDPAGIGGEYLGVKERSTRGDAPPAA
jgi:hypothetical protein